MDPGGKVAAALGQRVRPPAAPLASRAAARTIRRMSVPPRAPGLPGAALAADDLFTELYNELRRLARREVARFDRNSGSSATTLLHEAWLTLAHRADLAFADRAAFLAYAARAMRTVAIDRARERGALKRGGGNHMTSLDTAIADECADPQTLVQIGTVLDELAAIEPALANVVDLRFFCGLTMAEIAALQGRSERTVQRQWEKARLLLFRALAP